MKEFKIPLRLYLALEDKSNMLERNNLVPVTATNHDFKVVKSVIGYFGKDSSRTCIVLSVLFQLMLYYLLHSYWFLK